MAEKKIEATVVEAFGREFVQGNVPEINEVRCLGCSLTMPDNNYWSPNQKKYAYK